MKVELDPPASEAYAAVPLPVAVKADEIMDWIENDDEQRRHKPARYVDGQWAVTFRAVATWWVLIWELDGEVAVVRHIGEVTSIGV